MRIRTVCYIPTRVVGVPVTRDLRVISLLFISARLFGCRFVRFFFLFSQWRHWCGNGGVPLRPCSPTSRDENTAACSNAFDFVSISYVCCIRKLPQTRAISLISSCLCIARFQHSHSNRLIQFRGLCGCFCTSYSSTKIKWKGEKVARVGEFRCRDRTALLYLVVVPGDALHFWCVAVNRRRCCASWMRKKNV